MMLASFGHHTLTKSRWRKRSGKFRHSCICFDIPLLTTMEYQQHNLRYKTRQIPSEEEGNGDYDSTGYNSQCDIEESEDDEMKTLCIKKKVTVKKKIADS